MPEAELLDEALQLLALILDGASRHLQHGLDVVLDGELAEYARLLREIADAVFGTLVDGKFGDVVLVEEYLAFVGGYQSNRHVECGGLARSVGAEQTDNLTLLHIDAHMVCHGTLAVFLDKVVGAEHHFLGRPHGICRSLRGGSGLLWRGVCKLLAHGQLFLRKRDSI